MSTGHRMGGLILLRHGESVWNARNLFAGWVDVELSPRGVDQARRAGQLLREHGALPDVVHTSLLSRSINTAAVALDKAGRSWIPVHRSWRLNERHYGALQGRDRVTVRDQYGDEQFTRWRRSYDGTPPPVPDDDDFSPASDPRYASLKGRIPRAESLRDLTARLLPYWDDAVVPDLKSGRTVLVTAHGNTLRALIKHLDQVSDTDIIGLNVPTGVPLWYTLNGACRPTGPARYLDPVAAAEGIALVEAQGTRH
jgi:2,3-bisphosphoglycerate-dependent phosphoglycerate mutase